MSANKKILLIEDDLDTRTLYADILKNGGYEVDTSPDGQEGLLQAQSGSYDIVLLDIMLPTIDGLEVLSVLKKEKPSLKVVLFTNLSSENLIEQAQKKGADAFILKSDIDPDKLLEQIKNLIG